MSKCNRHSRFPMVVTLITLIFFYAPLIIVATASFNASKYGGRWTGFSLKWYQKLFSDYSIWEALSNTLIIALIATFFSTLLGTLAALALYRSRSRFRGLYYALVYSPLVVPDILLGISLLLLFVSILSLCGAWVEQLTGIKMELGMTTIIIAHITFCMSYVTMVVLGRLQDFDSSLIEAAQDLGAPTHLVFRRVIFPLSIPGVISGITMVFVPSVSTFVISQMLGSGKNLLVGDLIDLQFMGGAYNPHLGSAIALVMIILIFICMWIMNKFDDGSSEEGGLLL